MSRGIRSSLLMMALGAAFASEAAIPEAFIHRGVSSKTSNGGQGRGAVARMKRAARKRRNIRKNPRGSA